MRREELLRLGAAFAMYGQFPTALESHTVQEDQRDGLLPYDHRQHAHWLRVLLVGLALLDASLLVALKPNAGVVLPAGAACALLLLAAWLFGSLRVQVDGTRVRVAYGPGWPARTLQLADVTAAEPVRNRWWWGWGIRLTPTGWMWNVSGLDAVLVTHARGRRLRIGTPDPHGLAHAIRDAAHLPQ